MLSAKKTVYVSPSKDVISSFFGKLQEDGNKSITDDNQSLKDEKADSFMDTNVFMKERAFVNEPLVTPTTNTFSLLKTGENDVGNKNSSVFSQSNVSSNFVNVSNNGEKSSPFNFGISPLGNENNVPMQNNPSNGFSSPTSMDNGFKSAGVEKGNFSNFVFGGGAQENNNSFGGVTQGNNNLFGGGTQGNNNIFGGGTQGNNNLFGGVAQGNNFFGGGTNNTNGNQSASNMFGGQGNGSASNNSQGNDFDESSFRR